MSRKTILIANLGVNWAVKGEKNSSRAKQMVYEAVQSGADAICVPYLSAEHYFADPEMAEKMAGYDMTEEVFSAILEAAASQRVAIWVTPYYYKDIRYLELKDVDGYHIPNGSLEYWPLLKAIKKTEKPVMLSTGHASLDEVEAAIEALDQENQDITVLHSTGGLPTSARDSQIFRILDLIEEFTPLFVGYESFTSTEGSFMDILALTFMPDILMRRFDLEDALGVETEYSLSPSMLAELRWIIDEMQNIRSPELYGNSGLTQSDYHAREKTHRCEKGDYLVPSKR